MTKAEQKAKNDIHRIVEALEGIAAQLTEPSSPHTEGVFLKQQATQRTALDAAIRRYGVALAKRLKGATK